MNENECQLSNYPRGFFEPGWRARASEPDALPARAPDSTPVEIRLAQESTPPSNLKHARESAEREHILHILRETHWVVGGPNGAAARLGLKRSTLQWKLKKLGISRPG